MSNYRVISSDSHVVEPPDLWPTRLPAEFRNPGLRVEKFDDGDWWVCQDIKIMVGALQSSMAGRRFTGDFSKTDAEITGAGLPGGYIPEEHVKDMDTDGVYGGVLYPSIGLALFRFNPGTRFLNAIFSAYNDWLAEFCSACPQRLKGIGMVNLEDVDAGIKEMERCAQIGLSGIMITTYPEGVGYFGGNGYDSPMYEPVWAAAQDLDIPVSFHFTTNRPMPGEKKLTRFTDKRALLTNVDHWIRMSLSYMIFTGVFERYPKLRIVSVENELSWVPHFLDRIDYTYTQRDLPEDWYRFKEDMLPSDYFHRNVFCSFQEDGLGIKLRQIIGVDCLIWGSDYPHTEGTFPKSREILEEILTDCTEEEKAKIAGENTAKLYHFD